MINELCNFVYYYFIDVDVSTYSETKANVYTDGFSVPSGVENNCL